MRAWTDLAKLSFQTLSHMNVLSRGKLNRFTIQTKLETKNVQLKGSVVADELEMTGLLSAPEVRITKPNNDIINPGTTLAVTGGQVYDKLLLYAPLDNPTFTDQITVPHLTITDGTDTFTLGIEEEYLLVDLETLDLAVDVNELTQC